MPRKAKKKQYFTQETEDAICRYNDLDPDKSQQLETEYTMNILELHLRS